MKYSKVVLGGFLAFAALGAACEKYKAPSTTDQNTAASSPASFSPIVSDSLAPLPSASFTIVQTPRPASSVDDASPKEPIPYKTVPPFILGKPAIAFNGVPVVASPAADTTNVVPSKISGVVYGYDVNTKTYKVLSNANVSIGGVNVTTDLGGKYVTATEVAQRTDISASASDYISSTVTSVAPGENRDIHLQPLDGRIQYNANTITSEIITLAAESPKPANVPVSATPTPAAAGSATPFPTQKYPSVIAFGDKDNSRFITNVIDATTGRIRVEVNPISNKTVAQGQLFIYDLERDSLGKPTNPTQMKSFIFKKDASFRVGDVDFPILNTSTTTTTTTTVTQADLLKNFFNINAKFTDSYGFSNFVCNAYIVFPTGEKVLVSRYSGGMPTNLSFRVPKFNDITVSYSIEGHAGSDTLGSDVVVKDLHEGDSMEVYLLNPPTALKPDYDSGSTGATPSFTWSGLPDAKAYQVELNPTDIYGSSSWEAFTDMNTVTYPATLGGLKLNSQYQYQVLALDFNPGGLNILSNKAVDRMKYRLMKNNFGDLKYSIKLASHNTKILPRGYRVSYNTVLFRAK